MQHTNLGAGRWKSLTFLEQMANVGGEVERALIWKAAQNAEYSQKAFERALELIDLTLECSDGLARRREVARVREALVDYFFGANEYASTMALWRNYFLPFTFAHRKNY